MRFRRSLIAPLLLTAVLMLPVPAALAAVDSDVSGTTLTVTGDGADDTITITCIGGVVRVNGVGAGINCNAVTRIVINAGGGNDDIDASAVTGGLYPALTEIEVSGGNGVDDHTGWSGTDTFNGGNGSDRMYMSTGNDVFNGQGTAQDTDSITSTCSCNQTLTNNSLGRTGNGTTALTSVELGSLTGGPAADVLEAGSFSGRANLTGGAGGDTLTGGAGGNVIAPENGVDTVNAGGGDDLIFLVESVNSNDTLNGGSGTDRINHSNIAANVVLSNTQITGVGTDSLSSIDTAELNRVNAGTIDATAFTGTADLGGSGAADTLLGGSGDDTINGQAGSDTLDGNGGTDSTAVVVTGNTTVTNAGVFVTGGFNDLTSDFERITIYGDDNAYNYDFDAFTNGAISVFDNGGNDNIVGNTMTHFGTQADSPVTMTNTLLTASGRSVDYSGLSSANVQISSPGNATLSAGSFSKPLRVYSGDGNDTLTTGRGKDWVQAGGGNDEIKTNRGVDTIYGEEGSDDINAGRGKDKCNGGQGSDNFTSCEKTFSGDAPK